VHNLAIRLGEAGRRAEGLVAAQEAVDLYRELARDDLSQYGRDVERTDALRAHLDDHEH